MLLDAFLALSSLWATVTNFLFWFCYFSSHILCSSWLYILILPEIHATRLKDVWFYLKRECWNFHKKSPKWLISLELQRAMFWSYSMQPVVLPWSVFQRSVGWFHRSVWKAEVHLNRHYNMQCLVSRPSVKNWNPWSRNSLKRGRTQRVYWHYSRSRISWQRTYQMSTLQHLKAEWLH